MMSQLQLSLLILGGGLLLALGVYNIWLTLRIQPDEKEVAVDSSFHVSRSNEPGLDVGEFDVDGASSSAVGLDALIDAIAPITMESPVLGETVLAALPPMRLIGSKPFAIEGFNISTHRWEAPRAGQSYRLLQAGIQLVNRSGALSNIEFSDFVTTTQHYCDLVNGTPDFPIMKNEINRARELDQFASEHDAQLCFVLRAKQAAWSPDYILQTAARHGFIAGAEAGRMVIPAIVPGMPPVLGLTFEARSALSQDSAEAALRQVVLSLDVTHIPRSEAAFDRMRSVAMALAWEMDGTVTDDRGVDLPQEAMDVIAAELTRLYDTLDQRELSAGSPLALRLFS